MEENNSGDSYRGDLHQASPRSDEDRALMEAIKQDIIQELESQRPSTHTRQKSYPEASGQGAYRSGPRQSWGPADMERIKREVLRDLQGDLEDQNYYPSNHRALVDSVKNEVIAEMEAYNAAQRAATYGYGNQYTNQNLNKMVDQRYRVIENTKRDLRRELEAIRNIENKTTASNPYVREMAGSIIKEAQEQGMSMDEVIKILNGQGSSKSNWRYRMTDWLSIGQRKGFFYGVGTTLLAAMIFPAVNRNMRSVAVRTLEEGMDLADKARSFVVRAKEGFEDIVAEATFNSIQEDNESDIEKSDELH
ncbi:MAG: hypothetical protein ACYCX4_18485 [Bacillota bacterium]